MANADFPIDTVRTVVEKMLVGMMPSDVRYLRLASILLIAKQLDVNGKRMINLDTEEVALLATQYPEPARSWADNE